MGGRIELTIEDGRFHAQRREKEIREEGLLDGIYVIRTSESKGNLPAPDVVRHYKNLANVERAFRCWKGMDIRVRPIYLRTEPLPTGLLRGMAYANGAGTIVV